MEMTRENYKLIWRCSRAEAEKINRAKFVTNIKKF